MRRVSLHKVSRSFAAEILPVASKVGRVLFGAIAVLAGVSALLIGLKNVGFLVEARSMPREELLFVYSFLSCLFLGIILVSSGLLSIFAPQLSSDCNLVSLLKPKPKQVYVLVAFLVLSTFVLFSREATTKVTWIDRRGIPMPFLDFHDDLFACDPDIYLCLKKSLEEFRFLPLLGNAALYYYAASILHSSCRKLRAA